MILMNNEYKSSPARLAKHFQKSRDNWKNKTLNVKAELKNTKKKFKYTKKNLTDAKEENKLLSKKLKVAEGKIKKKN